MIVDFRKTNLQHEKIYIEGQEVEIVENYKYLGVNINNRLDWHAHTTTIISKINQRMHFVRKLNFFKIDKTLISLFYRSIINSVISFCICAWGGNTAQRDISKIDRVTRQARKITNEDQFDFKELFQKACVNKITKILKDTSHPLHNQIIFSSRSNRVLLIRSRKERFKNSFLPLAVKIYSSKQKR